MEEARHIADRLRSAEMELQFAQRAFDGSDQARQRYARALQDMEHAQKLAMSYVKQNTLRS